jgi:hypothetical protein
VGELNRQSMNHQAQLHAYGCICDDEWLESISQALNNSDALQMRESLSGKNVLVVSASIARGSPLNADQSEVVITDFLRNALKHPKNWSLDAFAKLKIKS